jgi:hypothetical protein
MTQTAAIRLLNAAATTGDGAVFNLEFPQLAAAVQAEVAGAPSQAVINVMALLDGGTWDTLCVLDTSQGYVSGEIAPITLPAPLEVLDEQSTLFALLYLVEHVPAKSIKFAELIKAPLGGVAVGRIEARGAHYAQWRGPAKRWCIIGPTGTVVRDGMFSKEEADRDVTTRNMPTSMAFVSHPRM